MIEARASAIDEQRSTVILTNGGKVRYGKLVVATGASPVVPFPVTPGAAVLTVRKIDDVAAARGRLKRNMKVLLVGAGLIGLHLAQVSKPRPEAASGRAERSACPAWSTGNWRRR